MVCDGRPRDQNGGSGCKRERAGVAAAVSVGRQRKREVSEAGSSGSARESVAVERGLEAQQRGSVVMRRRVCGKGRQRERARAVSVADSER